MEHYSPVRMECGPHDVVLNGMVAFYFFLTKKKKLYLTLFIVGTNLLHSIFNLSTLFVNGNILISESSITIENNLFIQKNSVLTLQNCNIFVSGMFYLINFFFNFSLICFYSTYKSYLFRRAIETNFL